MKKFLEKRMKIYTAEQGRFFWMLFIFFAIYLVTPLFRNYTDTAFLKRYGPEHIPLMLIINSILTFIVFGVANRLGRRFLDYSLFSGFLVFYALSVGGLFFMVKADIDLAYPILYQLLNLLDSILLLYLWNMAGDLFDARQGKRIFPLITAAQVLATSLGNFSTKAVTGLIGQDPTLLIFGGTCLVLALFLARTGKSRLENATTKEAQDKPHRRKLTELPRMIKEYPIIRFLIVVGLVPSIVLPIFTYQFSVIANNTFTSEEALISFLGLFRGGMTLVTFVMLFIVGRLYSRIGLANSSLAWPLNFTILFSLLSFFFNIYVAAAGQFATRLLQRAIHGPVTKILFSIIPGDLMLWSRTFIRGTVGKVGMLTGSLLMIFLKPVIDAQYLAPIALIFTLWWVVEALIFGRHYRRSLKQVIMERRIDFDQIEAARALDAGEHDLGRGHVPLEDRQEELLAEVDCQQMDPEEALSKLGDNNPTVRAEAAASFACNQDPRAINRLVKLLDEEEVVRKAAIDSLMTYRESTLPFLESYILHAPARAQRSILEAIRLSGAQGFEMRPFIGLKMTQAYNNLIALNRLQSVQDGDGLEMLTTHLREKNEEIISLVFHALWVQHPDMRLMYEALHSKDASIAVEMVEATLSRSLALHLIPLIEDIPIDEKIERGRRTFPLINRDTLERILVYLAMGDDPTTKTLALLVMGQIKPRVTYFLPVVERAAADPHPDVRQTAEFTLGKCLHKDVAMPEIIETINKLKTFTIFDQMGIRELQALASITTLESFSPDEVLIREGVEAGSIYLIVSGNLGVYKDYGGPEQTRKVLLGEGSFVGELSLFTPFPPNASCVAVEPLEAFVIRHHQFQEIMKIYPQIGINMCSFLSTKLRETTY
jgi:hypothetical protein